VSRGGVIIVVHNAQTGTGTGTGNQLSECCAWHPELTADLDHREAARIAGSPHPCEVIRQASADTEYTCRLLDGEDIAELVKQSSGSGSSAVGGHQGQVVLHG